MVLFISPPPSATINIFRFIWFLLPSHLFHQIISSPCKNHFAAKEIFQMNKKNKIPLPPAVFSAFFLFICGKTLLGCGGRKAEYEEELRKEGRGNEKRFRKTNLTKIYVRRWWKFNNAEHCCVFRNCTLRILFIISIFFPHLLLLFLFSHIFLFLSLEPFHNADRHFLRFISKSRLICFPPTI